MSYLRHYIGVFAAMLFAAQSIAQTQSPSDQADRMARSFELTDETFPEWKNFILPTPAEACFEKVDWHNTFGQGLVTADREQRPLLLYVMNGHPLACT